MNAEYVPHVVEFLGYSEENGQGLTKSDECQGWKCHRWEGNVKMAPKLVRNEKGFRVCPVCGCSYGR